MNRKQIKSRGEALRKAALERVPGDLRAARDIFDKELTPKDQVRLASELVKTRGPELCRAFPDVVAVSYGYKKKTVPNSKKDRLLRRLCIRFTVRRKRRRMSRIDEERRIPKFLYAYWNVRGQRCLCAIPTDVEDAKHKAGATPLAGASMVRVTLNSGEHEEGMVACAIRRKGFDNLVFVISCRHVFSLTKEVSPEALPDGRLPAFAGDIVRIGEAAGGPEFAETVLVCGDLQDNLDSNHDAQLAQVTHLDQLKNALGNLRMVKFIEDKHDVLAEYPRLYIETSNGTIAADVSEIGPAEINYRREGVRNVVMSEILILHPAQAVEPGDSGSPVTTKPGGGLLAGILIGRHAASADVRETAYVIPASDLLDPRRYRNGGPPNSWSLVDPASLPR